MKTTNDKEKEIICLHTHRTGHVLKSTLRSAPRNNLNIKRASKCDYVIFSLNKNSSLFREFISNISNSRFMQLDHLYIDEIPNQDTGFMICKITNIDKLSNKKHSNIHPDDPFYEISFREYAEIDIPSLYENKKNPISYFSEQEILDLLNIKSFDNLEWSLENYVKPKFIDETNVSDEKARSQIVMQNREETQFYEDLNRFIQTEIDEIIGSNVYVNDDEISKNLFIELQKKRFADGELKVDFPYEVCTKEGSVIEILKTIEEHAEHSYWMMVKATQYAQSIQELIYKKRKKGEIIDLDILISSEESQKIANNLDIDIQWTDGNDSNEGEVIVNSEDNIEGRAFFNAYKKDNVGELSIDEAKIGLSKKYDIPFENIQIILKG